MPSLSNPRLSARAQAIREQLAEADRYDRRRLLDELNATIDAISETPEGKYLEEASEVEGDGAAAEVPRCCHSTGRLPNTRRLTRR